MHVKCLAQHLAYTKDDEGLRFNGWYSSLPVFLIVSRSLHHKIQAAVIIGLQEANDKANKELKQSWL